jgi:exosortase
MHSLGFTALLAVSLLQGWRALADTFLLALRDDQYTYILLILPVSVALILLERQPLRAVAKLRLGTGLACLSIAGLIASSTLGLPAVLPADVQLSARMLALVAWWTGAFLLCFGSRAARLVSFPLCFLLGLVPLPQIAVNAIVALLQYGSAWAAQVLFSACGVPVVQEGVIVSIPGLTLHIAEECSSIRSSSMLLVTTMVVAQLLLRSPWRKALLIGLTVPLSVAKNGLRIFAIAMLGIRVDPGYLTGKLHHEGGVIFFAIILGVILALLWVLRTGELLPPQPGAGPVKGTETAD